MTLVPAGQGLVATGLVVLILLAYIAIGSAFLPPRTDGDGTTAPAAILIGSGIVAFALALFAAAGMVKSGTILIGVVSVVVLFARRAAVSAIVGEAVAPLRELAASRLMLAAMCVAGIVTWLSAAAPPRSADAMRYHLAHIRQIVGEGRWAPIADYHYALPFGWSLSYLPFEMLGLPQGAQLLGAALLVILFAAIAKMLSTAGVNRAGVLIALAFLFHPAVLRAFSEASADAYALVAVFTVAVLLTRLPRIDTRDAALVGFTSWIGLQSRYQLAAVGIAATAVFVVEVRSRSNLRRLLASWAGGSAAALVLASPFYVANALTFGNPVWPLLIARPSAATSYADVVAYDYSLFLTGSRAPADVAQSVVELFTTYILFPLSIVIVGAIAAALLSRTRATRIWGAFGGSFLLLWFAMQPRLYPRFVLLMLPVALLALGVMSGRFFDSRRRLARFAAAAAFVVIAILTAADVAVARDGASYVITGDASAHHRYTWFYPVYDWMNHETPKTARSLVIVSSGHSYYLDRPYRRADPWLSGVVDWRVTGTADKLASLLRRGGYSYVIYEERNWSQFPGGTNMQRAIAESRAAGMLTPVKSFDERLYTSRLRREYRVTHVDVLVVQRRR